MEKYTAVLLYLQTVVHLDLWSVRTLKDQVMKKSLVHLFLLSFLTCVRVMRNPHVRSQEALIGPSFRRTFFRLLVLCLVTTHLSLVHLFGISQERAGTMVSFLQLGMNSRMSALGNAGSSLVGGIMASQSNPAGFGGIKQQEMAFSHIQHVEGISFSYAGYGYPLKVPYREVYLGVSVLHGVYGDLERTEVVTGSNRLKKVGSFSASDSAGTLTVSGKVLDKLMLGVNLRYLQENIGGVRGSGYGLDLGGIYEVKREREVKLGFVVKHLGKGIQLDREMTPLPTAYSIGISGLLMKSLFVSVDVERPKVGSLEFKFGGEYRLGKKVSFRAGSRGSQDPITQIGFGVGINVKRFRIDYALTPFEQFGNMHRLSGTIRFGKVRK